MGWKDGDEDFQWRQLTSAGNLPRATEASDLDLDFSKGFRVKNSSTPASVVTREVAKASLLCAVSAVFLLVVWPALTLPARYQLDSDHCIIASLHDKIPDQQTHKPVH